MSFFEKSLKNVRCIMIGASAGGLSATKYILKQLDSINIPIIIIQHLSDRQLDLITSYFSELDDLDLLFVDDKMELENKVYFAPPNFHLLLENENCFALNTDAKVNYSRPSIDVFMESAANVFEEKLLAVILTGANCDGTNGSVYVKKKSGMVIVQDPIEAEVNYMPKSVIRKGKYDKILKLDEIAETIKYVQNGDKE
jgi:two-component system chemotaxis response regulator CheB